MDTEVKAAPKRDPLEVLKGFGGILPGKFIYATPPIYKEVYPNDPSRWAVFKIKPADGLDFNEDVDNDSLYRVVDGKVLAIAGKVRSLKLKKGIKGWKGFKDGDLSIPFLSDADGNLTDEGLRCLKPDLQNWLLSVISDSDQVTPSESEGLKF